GKQEARSEGRNCARRSIDARIFCDVLVINTRSPPANSIGTARASVGAMNQWREEMKERTHKFSVDVILLLQTIPDRTDTRRVKDQLAGAASGLDLNWRSACRARSHKEFTAKVGTVLEEADEAEGCLQTIWDA